MKAIIKAVEFTKEFKNEHGTFYSFKISYNDKFGFYVSKSNPQTKFIKGSEAEFEELTQKSDKGEWIKIKPVAPAYSGGRGGYSKPTLYGSFAVSYAKDLIIAGKIDYDNLIEAATDMFNLMKKLDG
ncbi:MAG: hypothetical protein DRJ07_19025 [Bacteroidetes bacterium]|nr:MAG: hypothetical protein DRJ07_19025 [Bacteroidota bacterium]